MTWHPGTCQQGCGILLPSEPLSFSPSAPNPSFLPCPLPGVHPGRAVTCLITACGRTLRHCKANPSESKPSLMRVLHMGPYPLHMGSLGL